MVQLKKTDIATPSDIGVAEINLALQELLEGNIKTTDILGKERSIPIYFRDRDSKKIPDSTAKGMITIAWSGETEAESAYQERNCDIFVVITEDEDGNPLEFQQIKAPEIVWHNYTITGRAEHWDDLIKIQSMLSKFFPTRHSSININGCVRELRRDSSTPTSDEELGIFIIDYSIRILGRSFGLDCNENIKIVPTIKIADLEICIHTDNTTPTNPDCAPIEIIRIVEC